MAGLLGVCEPCGVMGATKKCWFCGRPWSKKDYASTKACGQDHDPEARQIMVGGRYGCMWDIDPDEPAALVEF